MTRNSAKICEIMKRINLDLSSKSFTINIILSALFLCFEISADVSMKLAGLAIHFKILFISSFLCTLCLFHNLHSILTRNKSIEHVYFANTFRNPYLRHTLSLGEKWDDVWTLWKFWAFEAIHKSPIRRTLDSSRKSALNCHFFPILMETQLKR